MAVQPMTSESCCPCCAGRVAYRLADGRRKCRECGKKFTPRPRRSRLPDRVLRQVSLYFWHMVPAARVAEELNLNRKSVQRHYRLLRQAIGHGAAGYAGLEWAGGAVDEPVFAVALQEGEVRVVFSPSRRPGPGEGTGVGSQTRVAVLFFAASERALKLGDLTDFQLSIPVTGGTVRAQQEHVKVILNFWDFVRRLKKLNRYRRQQDFAQFLCELEFRFNNRDNPQIINELSMILQTGGK